MSIGYSKGTAPLVGSDANGFEFPAVVAVDQNGLPIQSATDPFGTGTREHVTGSIRRRAVTAVSALVDLPPLGVSREIYVMANQRAYFLTGVAGVIAAPGTSHPLAQDERFYCRVPAGHTHIAFIRDTLDGNITICAVA